MLILAAISSYAMVPGLAYHSPVSRPAVLTRWSHPAQQHSPAEAAPSAVAYPCSTADDGW